MSIVSYYNNLLLQESKIPVDDICPERFAELHRNWEAINVKDLGPALEWVSQHSAQLELKNSQLEFKLHRLAFLQVRIFYTTL